MECESDDLSCRVVALEVRSKEQSDEIAGLKKQIVILMDKLNSSGDSHSKPFKSTRRSIAPPLPSKFEPTHRNGSSDFDFKKPRRPSTVGIRKSSQPTSTQHMSLPTPSPSNMRRSISNTSINSIAQKKSQRRLSMSSPKVGTSYNADDGSVKMYLKGRPVVLYKPSHVQDYQVDNLSQLPDKQLQLQWVYGYRGKDCRQNIHVLKQSGEIVYYTAAVVVIYDPIKQQQRHYDKHNDDVKSLAIHPDQTIAASGQVAGLELDGKEYKGTSLPTQPRIPQIHVWNIETLETLHVLSGFQRSVVSIGFSYQDGGKLLVAVDESNDHVLSVWNWSKQTKLAEQKSSKDAVFVAQFNPTNNSSIVSCGKSHVAFWNFNAGSKELVKKVGLYEKHEKPRFVLCVAFDDAGNLITGDSSGNIQVWSVASRKITTQIQKVHAGAIFGICKLDEQQGYITTGRDGFVKKHTTSFVPITEKQITDEVCRAIAYSSNNDGGDVVVYVGTKNNNIMTGSIEDVEPFTTVVQSHFEELWGLAINPSQSSCFITAAYDKMLICRNSQTRTIEWSKVLDEAVQSVEFNSDGSLLAVAMKSGKWLVMDTSSREIIHQQQDGNEQHDVIKFSPDDKYLAIGSHDNSIYVYKVEFEDGGHKLSKHGKCSGHSSFITHLDWSNDSQYIMSNSGDYEVLVWNSETCKQITSSSTLRDVEWKTQTCTLSFNTIGIWPEGADGTDVNSCGKSNDSTLLVTGDDFGKVHLYSYPSIQPQSLNYSHTAHSSHVTSAKFVADDSLVITTGGQDCSVMQWRVV